MDLNWGLAGLASGLDALPGSYMQGRAQAGSLLLTRAMDQSEIAKNLAQAQMFGAHGNYFDESGAVKSFGQTGTVPIVGPDGNVSFMMNPGGAPYGTNPDGTPRLGGTAGNGQQANAVRAQLGGQKTFDDFIRESPQLTALVNTNPAMRETVNNYVKNTYGQFTGGLGLYPDDPNTPVNLSATDQAKVDLSNSQTQNTQGKTFTDYVHLLLGVPTQTQPRVGLGFNAATGAGFPTFGANGTPALGPGPLDASKVALNLGLANSANATAGFTAGPKSAESQARAALDTQLAKYVGPKFQELQWTDAQKMSIQQKALQLKAAGLDDQTAYRAAMADVAGYNAQTQRGRLDLAASGGGGGLGAGRGASLYGPDYDRIAGLRRDVQQQIQQAQRRMTELSTPSQDYPGKNFPHMDQKGFLSPRGANPQAAAEYNQLQALVQRLSGQDRQLNDQQYQAMQTFQRQRSGLGGASGVTVPPGGLAPYNPVAPGSLNRPPLAPSFGGGNVPYAPPLPPGLRGSNPYAPNSYGNQPVPTLGGLSPAGLSFRPGVRQWDPMMLPIANKYGVPPDLVRAVMQQESGGQARVTSPAGAMGLMQIMPGKPGVTDPYDPRQNIEAGVRELANDLRLYHGNRDLALAAYNAGPGNVAKYGGIPPFRETQNYVRSIDGMLGAGQGGGQSYPASGQGAPAPRVQPRHPITGQYQSYSANGGGNGGGNGAPAIDPKALDGMNLAQLRAIRAKYLAGKGGGALAPRPRMIPVGNTAPYPTGLAVPSFVSH